jgi:hypothetical protein
MAGADRRQVDRVDYRLFPIGALDQRALFAQSSRAA